MLRVAVRRLGGRVGKTGGTSILPTGAAVGAAVGATNKHASSTSGPTSVASETDITSMVDIVLPPIDCNALKQVISSSSSSSNSTDIPYVARVLRLDCTPHPASAKKKNARGTAAVDSAHPLADIHLVNRIHAAIVDDAKKRAYAGEGDAEEAEASDSDAETPSRQPPLVVLVETNLSSEDAEVQQFVLRNALRMHAVPVSVAVEVKERGTTTEKASITRTVHVATPPLSVLVLDREVTQRVRSLDKLPLASPTLAATPAEKQSDAADATPSAKEINPTIRAADGDASDAPAGRLCQSPKATDTAAATTEKSTTVPTVAHAQRTQDATSSSLPPAETAKKAVSIKNATAAGVPKPGGVATPKRLPKHSQPHKRAAALLRQHAAGKQKGVSGRRSGLTRAKMQRRPTPATATGTTSHSLPPRLLSVDDTTEKVLWASRPGQPLPLAVLAPLIRASALAKMCAAAAAAPLSPPKTHKNVRADPSVEFLAMHTIVYRAGNQSSAQTIWRGAVQAAADLAMALSGGHSLLPAAVTELAAHQHATVSVEAPHRLKAPSSQQQQRRSNSNSSSSSSKSARRGRRHSADTRDASVRDGDDADAVAMETPYVYLLVHTSLSPQDAAVLQQELNYHYLQLKGTPAGAEVAGLSVLTTEDVSSTQLWYVLEHGIPHRSSELPQQTGGLHGAVAPASPHYPLHTSKTASPESAEMARTFQEVYRLLSEQSPELLHSPLLAQPADAARDGRGSDGSSRYKAPMRHPDTLVSEAIRVAALTQVLVERKEAQLREELAAEQQRSAVSADSEAVARAAQKVEIKTMVTEAVEEVSVRHEQATAHLVKTLSSMVGQWSLDKLSDTLEAIMRDEVKPIMDVLEERLGTSAPPPPAVPTASEEEAVEAAADTVEGGTAPLREQESTILPSSTPAEVHNMENEAALLEGQVEMKERLSHILTQLRELSERVSALSHAATAAAAPATSKEPAEESVLLDKQPAVDEDRLLQSLSGLQREHQRELQQALDTLKEELQSAQPSAAIAKAPLRVDEETCPPRAAEIPSDVLDAAVSRTVEEVSLALRNSIQQSVTQQLDSYCEVLRHHQSENGNNNDSGSYGMASLPVLPVTSFELEEMLTRTVSFAMRDSMSEMEGQVRTAMEMALQSHAASARSSAAPERNADDGLHNGNASMKAALEELWAQVKAEAAEEEAVKLSQHNRQLHRLFRRQQHLQKTSGGAADMAAADGGLTVFAVEGAVRAAMHPYMMQMQASLAAAAAATGSRSASKPEKDE